MKEYADGQGVETTAPVEGMFDVGLFTVEPGKKGFTHNSILVMNRYELHSGKQKIVLYSRGEPQFAGVDPYNKHIDRHPDRNVVKVIQGS
jgi:hypothetical protein